MFEGRERRGVEGRVRAKRMKHNEEQNKDPRARKENRIKACFDVESAGVHALTSNC